MKNYRLVSPVHGVLSLDTLKNNINATSGVQVQPGSTGLGLPPLEVQYQASAGDGAVFRSTRVAQRDFDLPLYLFAPTEKALGELIAQVTRFLSGDLQFMCDGTTGTTAHDGTWYLDVRHVGGGDLVMGVDTDHKREAYMTITLRAGDPYWQRTTPIAFSKPVTPEVEWDGTLMEMVTTTFDSVDTVVRVHGPAKGFRLIRKDTPSGPSRTALIYENYIAPGETVTVDFAEGTVTGPNGVSLFQYVRTGANLLPLAPGASVSSEITLPLPGEIAAPSAQNHVFNPVFQAAPSASPSTGWECLTTEPTHWSTGSGFGLIFLGEEKAAHPGFMVTEAQGLTPGKLYDLVVRVNATARWSDLGVHQATEPLRALLGGWGATVTGAVLTVPQGVVTPREMRVSFRARGASEYITLFPSWSSRVDGATTYYRCLPAGIEGIGIVESGAPFFTGATAGAGGHTYNWAGTPHASISRRYTAGTTATTRMSGEIYPKAKVLI